MISKLPSELILKITNFLQYKDIVNLRIVSKEFKRIVDKNEIYIYSDLIKKDYLVNKSNKDIYKMFYNIEKKFFDISKLDKILESEYYTFLTKKNHCDFICEEIFDNDIYNIIEYLKKYIDLGYDINSVNAKGNTIIMELLDSLDIEEFELLNDIGVDFSIKNNKGENLFLLACKYCKIEEIKKIIEIIGNSLDINCTDNKGNNGLMKSLANLKEGVFSELLKYIDINHLNNKGQNIFLLSSFFKLKNFNKVIEVLGDDLDINFQDNDGNTALFNSFKYSKKIQKRLLELNADIEIKNNLGHFYNQKVGGNGFMPRFNI